MAPSSKWRRPISCRVWRPVLLLMRLLAVSVLASVAVQAAMAVAAVMTRMKEAMRLTTVATAGVAC